MKIISKNKKAFFEYEILKQFEAGIVLEGWEVKSIKLGAVSLKEGYVSGYKGELWVYGMHVSAWKYGVKALVMNETRSRKLLLNKAEVNHMLGQEQRAGLTIVPIDVHLVRGNVKLTIGLGRGKKLHDKRQVMKERDSKREIQKEMKGYK